VEGRKKDQGNISSILSKGDRTIPYRSGSISWQAEHSGPQKGTNSRRVIGTRIRKRIGQEDREKKKEW